MSLVRLLRGAMSDHPVILARKAPRTRSADEEPYRCRIEILAAPATAAPGATVEIHARVTNTGRLPWPVGSDGQAGIPRLGVQLLDRDRRLVDRDFHRLAIPEALASGSACEFRAACPAPRDPGTWWLKLDVVVEGVAWLESRGSQIALHGLRVE